jgi:hypothetical protein
MIDPRSSRGGIGAEREARIRSGSLNLNFLLFEA